MSRFRFEALAPDGSEVRSTIEAADVKAAQAILRRQGMFVNRLERVITPDDLERRCAECNHVNDRDVSLCVQCGSPLCGRRVDPDEPVQLPAGLAMRENIDGSIMIAKTGWRRWKYVFSCLVFLALLAAGWTFTFPNDGASRWIVVAACVIGVPVLLPCTVWALFGRHEWHVADNRLDQTLSIFGIHWDHTFRDGVIRVDLHATHTSLGSSGHSSTRVTYPVTAVSKESARALCRERRAADARAIGACLAQRTGWPLDDRLGD